MVNIMVHKIHMFSHISISEIQALDQQFNSTLQHTHNYPSVWAHLLLIQFTYFSLSCQSLKHCWLCPLFLMTLNRTYSATGMTCAMNWILKRIWSAKKKKKEHASNLAIWLTVAQKVLFNLIESF